ncbi:MAG: DegT/DnrJ/EryC1/StrS family aminotransferase [Pirellulaceae bacterium]
MGSPTVNVPLLDVSRDNEPIKAAMLAAFSRVLDSGRFLHGPEVRELEERVADWCGVPHAVACASGSDALLLSLMAWDIGPGDEVIVPSFTFFATASAVWRLGARVVFADIDPRTFNLCPKAVAAAVTPRTRAVIPVHLYGQCAELDAIQAIADRYRLRVLEDVAQAIGARYRGRPACSWGDAGCLSFYPTKNLGGCGDGGMVATRDAALAERLRLFAAHGMSPRYYHRVVGINSRLDTLQAAALLVKLNHLPEWNEQRTRNAQRYIELFHEASLDRWLTLPHEADGCVHVWNQFTIRVPEGQRDALREHLTRQGIGTEVYYPLPLHQQECFRSLGYATGALPATERAAAEVLNLPIFPGLREEEQRAVVAQIASFHAMRRAAA